MTFMITARDMMGLSHQHVYMSMVTLSIKAHICNAFQHIMNILTMHYDAPIVV